MMALVGTLTYEFQVVLPALATRTFHGDARSYGLITAAMGVGAVVGGLASAGQRVTGIAPMVTASAVFAATEFLAALSPDADIAAVALTAVGAASVWFLSTGNATLQLASAPAMRGRVMALWRGFLGKHRGGWAQRRLGGRARRPSVGPDPGCLGRTGRRG